jgi:DNA polymerase-3 subunit beta
VSISTEETRYYLNGIFVHVVDGRLVCVSTDGHRLVRYTMPAPVGASGMPGVIVPRKAVGEVLTLLKRKDLAGLPVYVDVSDEKVRFTVGDVVLTSKLIDGTFPDYQRVIPAYNANRATINRDGLADAVKQVQLISSERGRAVKFEPRDGALRLTVINQDSGIASIDVPATLDADCPVIGFNSRYVLDLLDLVDGDDVVFAFGDSGSPALVTDPTDDAFTAVIMPMRV